MKLQVLDESKLKEEIENFGKGNFINPQIQNGAYYNQGCGDEYLPIANTNAVPTMSMSYVDSVNRSKRMRDRANGLIAEKRNIALEASGADIEKDRYSHMDKFAKDLNSDRHTYTSPYCKGGAMNEGVVKKSNGKWTNKGKEGTHGDFKTKKEAQAQCRAMYANGYGEGLEEDNELDEKIVHKKNGKWTNIDASGKEHGEFKTRKQAVKQQKAMIIRARAAQAAQAAQAVVAESYDNSLDDSKFIAIEETSDPRKIAVTNIKYGINDIIKFVEVNYNDNTMSREHSTVIDIDYAGDEAAYFRYKGRDYYLSDFTMLKGYNGLTESRRTRR